MLDFRCHILAAASVPLFFGAAHAAENTRTAELFELSRASNAALMKGDIKTYESLISFTDDFVLFSPFGGKPTLAKDLSPESMERMGRFFRHGDLRLEMVGGWTGEDMAVLALIERSHVAVGELPSQEWALRVTLVYRRVDGKWKLAHRHADPLPGGISLAEAAALGAKPAPAP